MFWKTIPLSWTAKIIHERADILAFLAKSLGMKVREDNAK